MPKRGYKQSKSHRSRIGESMVGNKNARGRIIRPKQIMNLKQFSKARKGKKNVTSSDSGKRNASTANCTRANARSEET